MQAKQPEWRPVVGMEGYYEVSDMGQARSVARTVTRSDGVQSSYASKPAYVFTTTDGYLKLGMSKGCKRHMKFLHRAIAEAFLGPPPNAMAQVNHKNFNTQDNRLENLEWVTEKQNNEHACASGRRAKKLVAMDAVIIRSLRSQGLPLKEISACFSVSESVVSEIANRKSWAWAA